MKIDLQKIRKEVDAGYVSERKHPTEDLYIYNYTNKAQFDGYWNDVTVNARGLILDGAGQVIARPFQKFFTTDQIVGLRNSVHHLYGIKYSDIEKLPFRAFEKADGSLGILYWIKDKPFIATRGSFESEQAKWATELFQKHANYDYFDKNYTYLFEIVAKWNRIVVQYDWEGLVLLSIIRIQDGKEINLPEDTREMQTRLT